MRLLEKNLSIEIKLDGHSEPSIVGYTNILNHYQPKICTCSLNTTGVEVLSRLKIKGEALIYPSGFMENIKKANMSKEYFLLVLYKAIEDTHKLKEIKTISVNMNSSVLEQDITEEILTICTHFSFPVSKLILEITEDEDYLFNESVKDNSTRLTNIGVSLSLDDFGAGSATLSSFAAFPFSELKIDRYLTSTCHENKRSAEIIKLCVNLGKVFGVKVVAEGVETETVYSQVKLLGVKIVQGYYTGKPVPIENLTKRFSYS